MQRISPTFVWPSATWLDTVWRDLRYGARLLRRSPRFTFTALILLVLGIGSTTAIFSVAYAVLARPLPYRDAGGWSFGGEGRQRRRWPNWRIGGVARARRRPRRFPRGRDPRHQQRDPETIRIPKRSRRTSFKSSACRRFAVVSRRIRRSAGRPPRPWWSARVMDG